jgi:hypothetical protein
MLADAFFNIVVRTIEIGLGAGLLYFLYTVWRDARNALLK